MIRFQLVSLGGVKFNEQVAEITLLTLDGEIGVLTAHMPLVSVASHGRIAVRYKANDPDDFREFFAVSGGVVEVENNTLRILVDEADHANEINEADVKAAMELAQKMKAEATDQHSLEKAQQMIDRQAVRLQVAGLKRRSHRG